MAGYDSSSQWHTDLIYKCGGIDSRTIEKFEKVRTPFLFLLRHLHSVARWSDFLAYRTEGQFGCLGGVVRNFRASPFRLLPSYDAQWMACSSKITHSVR